MTIISIAYDADVPYDSDVWYYDGTMVHWVAGPTEATVGSVTLSEALIGGATLTETLIGKAASIGDSSASVTTAETLTGTAEALDE